MLDDDAKPALRHALAIRIAIGLAQGLVLYALHRWRAQLIPVAYGALEMTAWLVPVAALGAIGAARARTAALWLGAATLVTAVLGGYAMYVWIAPSWEQGLWLPPATAFFTAVTIYILHHLVLPAEAEGRWRASYERYFDEGWKDAVRLALGALFVGALWLLLWLGATLFNLIGLDFLQKLIEKPWFSYPATSVFFAISVHVTDVRIGLVRGARTLVLTLLSWLLPVLTLIAVGFLVALPFTGLKALWATRSSSGIMLAACAGLIILINAAYQDGEGEGFPPLVLKWVARIAAVALGPLALVAAYGLSLRIGQHGLTPSRVHAVACVIVAACYAAGYIWAAVGRGPWMKRLETTNWLTAHVAVVILLAIFSPVLDPTRISVDSQVQRLTSGRVPPAKFDYAFLRFNAGQWGQTALKRLAGDKNPEVAERAKSELKAQHPWGPPVLTQVERRSTLHAAGAPLPASFLQQVWPAGEDPAADCDGPLGVTPPKTPGCEALVTDFDDIPGPEIIVVGPNGHGVYTERNGLWVSLGQLVGQTCPDDRDAVREGRVQVAPAKGREVVIEGRRLVLVPQNTCPPAKTKDGKTAQANGDVTDVAIVKPVK